MAQCHACLLSARGRPPCVLGSGGHGTRENVRPVLPAVCLCLPQATGRVSRLLVMCRRRVVLPTPRRPVSQATCSPVGLEAHEEGPHSLRGWHSLLAGTETQSTRTAWWVGGASPATCSFPPQHTCAHLRTPCPPLLEGTAPQRLPHAPASLPSACQQPARAPKACQRSDLV